MSSEAHRQALDAEWSTVAKHLGELQQELAVGLDLSAPQRRHSERVGLPVGEAYRTAQRTREAPPAFGRAELPDPKAPVVAIDRVGALSEPAIELVGPPPGAPAKSQAAEQQPPRPAAETRMPDAAHAMRWGGGSRLSNHISWLSCPRPPPDPASTRRSIRGAMTPRRSRHTRAHRANATATSCSAPMRRTSCSRVSPSTFCHRWSRELLLARREAIPGEASAASWYQAPLSACSASSSEARESRAAAWEPGRPAAVWKFQAASAKSPAYWSRRSGEFMPASSCRRRHQGMGRNAQLRPAKSPSAGWASGRVGASRLELADLAFVPAFRLVGRDRHACMTARIVS